MIIMIAQPFVSSAQNMLSPAFFLVHTEAATYFGVLMADLFIKLQLYPDHVIYIRVGRSV